MTVGLGAGQELFLLQSTAIVTTFGYVATGAAIAEFRAGIVEAPEEGVVAGVVAVGVEFV